MDDPLLCSTIPIIATAVAAIVITNVLFKRASKSFERDCVTNSTFSNPIIGSVSLLSNDDSVLDRDGVKGSIEGYEKLYDGARKNVGTLSKEESIDVRAKEYKTLVNSFYDLVTDFYEWGWGQVSLDCCSLEII